MTRVILIILYFICVSTAWVSAQSNNGLLSIQLSLLQEQLQNWVGEAPAGQKAARLQEAAHWYHAVDAYGNLPTLSLDEPLEKLDPKEAEDLKQLQIHVNNFVTGNGPDAANLSRSFVQSLPSAKNQFTLEPFAPMYYYIGKDTMWHITIRGSFPLLLEDSTEVYLANGARHVGYATHTDSTITFRFLGSQLGLDGANAMDITKLQLHLVGQVGKKVNKKKQFVSIYHLFALALPEAAGKLTITKTSSNKNIEKQSKRTRTFLLNGSKGNRVEKQCLPAHDGWAVIPESVELVVESSSGTPKRDWNYHKSNKDGKTCFTTEVFFNSAGPSGKLEYYIKYDIKRNTTEELTETSEVALTWDEVKYLNFETPMTKVVYTDPWGTETVITETSYQSPWLQLEMPDKNSLAIKTPRLIP